nr:WAT1-related protein At2g39510-like [Ipomoea batatas]
MMRNERVVKWLNKAKPYLGVAFLQLSNVGSAIISKVALNQGMNPFTFTVYRNVIAAGMRFATATFAVTMLNLVPAITFLLAWIFRLENVKIKRLHTQAKIVGTTSTIGGAMIMTLVKGPTMVLPWTKHSKNIVSYSSQHVVNQHTDYIKAALLLTACCCCISCSRIGQGLLRSGTEYYISVIVMKMRGPVFVTAFNPLCMVIVAIVGSFLLSEKLYLGRYGFYHGAAYQILTKSKSDTVTNNLWVGNLTSDVNEAELTALFEKYGQVDSIIPYSARSYAFLYIRSLEDVKAANNALQGTMLRGNPLKNEFAKPISIFVTHHCLMIMIWLYCFYFLVMGLCFSGSLRKFHLF